MKIVNNKLSILIIALLIFSFNAFSQLTLQDSLKAYYPFNGNANDESSNGIDAIVTGANLTTDRFGNDSSAYEFDGIDDWINTAFSFDYEYRTVSVWAKPDDITGNNNTAKFFVAQDANTLTWGQFTARFEDGLLTMRAGGESSLFTMTGTVGSWVHVVLVRDAGTCSYYINGGLAGTASCGTAGSISNPNPELVIGAGRATSNQFFDGKIDDIRIYNRVLSAQEIDIIYNEQPLGITNEFDNVNPKIEVYPNPLREHATLEFYNSTKDDYILTLYDLQGRLVRTITDITTGKVEIGRENLTSGLYFFQLRNDRHVRATGKLTID